MDLTELKALYAGIPCRPLEIRVDLITPLAVGPDPLCLDCLLADRVALLLFGATARDRDRALVELPLPLKRSGAVWHASIAFPLAGSLAHDLLAKRWSVPPPPGVDTSQGWAKTARTPVHYLATPALVFWANGNPGEIRRLLTGVQAIGKHRKKGFGEVAQITVRPAPHDWSLWRDGQPQRPLPVDQVKEPWAFYIAATGFRPPTWDPRNQGLCVLPPPDVWLPAYHQPLETADPDEEDWNRPDGGDRSWS